MVKNKIALITGSAGALGRVVTKKFLENEASVVAIHHTEEKKDELLDFLGSLKEGVTAIQGDVTDEGGMNSIVESVLGDHGRIDILVNLVGGYEGGSPVHETEADIWDRMMGINLKSVFICSKAVLPSMLKNSWGRIVNVSSKSGLEKGRRARSGAYAVSKAGVAILSEVLAEETKGRGVNVNCVAPSVIDTPANREMFSKADYSKWVDPEEIAEVILFLSSDSANPTSGAMVPVYGRS